METYEEFLARKLPANVLVVDDVPATCAMHRLMLSRKFEVRTAGSGKEALALCAEKMPDLVLLDVEMPEMNGFDACRALRERTDIPIIFATAHDSAEEHLKAFEAGGNDICVKPVSAEILLHKVSLAIAQHHEHRRLLEEREALRSLAARDAPAPESGRGELLAFLQGALACSTPSEQARHFIESTRKLGIHCCVVIRHADGETLHSHDGEATPLERSVLTQLATLGPEIRFKNRLGLNYTQVSAMVSNLPEEDSTEARRIREQVMQRLECVDALLAHRTGPAVAPTASPPDDLRDTLQTLRARQRQLIDRVGLIMTELHQNMENSFDELATDKHQEAVLGHAMEGPLDKLRALLADTAANDQLFARLLAQSSASR